jgi:HAD superfamily hydrolase (TIGR01509 family)
MYDLVRDKVKARNEIFTAGRERRVSSHAHSARWPRAAVFDCDGLLVDSAACWHCAYRTVATEQGGELDGFNFGALAGVSIAGAAEQLTRELGVVVGERRLRAALLDCFAADPPAELPGVRTLVAALGAHIPLAVASNAPPEFVARVLEGLGMASAFEAVVSAELTAADKPAPDVYLEACRRLRVAPSDAIAFEDSPLGAQAARTAGLLVIAVPSEPRAHIDADLTVGRLSDPALFAFLGLAPNGAVLR